MSAERDPFAPGEVPKDINREGRVGLLLEAGEGLRDGDDVRRTAAMFLGSAVLAWLERGTDAASLVRDFLRIAAPRGSHQTPQEIARRLKRSHRR